MIHVFYMMCVCVCKCIHSTVCMVEVRGQAQVLYLDFCLFDSFSLFTFVYTRSDDPGVSASHLLVGALKSLVDTTSVSGYTDP